MIVDVKMGGGLTAGPLALIRDFVLKGQYGLYTLLSGADVYGRLDARVWFGAATLWLSAGIVGVVAAAYRRQER